MSDIDQLLDEALEAVSRVSLRYPYKLTAFSPVRGDLYKGDLMVVGRAVNGWGNGWLADEAKEPSKRRSIIDQVKSTAWAVDCCPMSWVRRDWDQRYICEGETCGESFIQKTEVCPKCGGNRIKRAYCTATSAFWRVIRAVTQKLAIANPDRDENLTWPSFLYWTDLYKISPEAGGNPTTALIAAQQNACERMLKEEIAQAVPKRILFLTGWDWARPFLACLGVQDAPPRQGHVTFCGKLQLALEQEALVVVAPHPQAKPEGEIVEEIIGAFQNLENGM